MSDVHYLTAEGYQRMQQELEYLKTTVRQQLAQRLRAAIQQGDLSENADYIAAKEEQGFIEGRIQELEQVLRNAVIIDHTEKKANEISIGHVVTVQEGNFPPETYHLVGPKEADPLNGRISHESPIGKALLGKKVGDEVIAETPGGTIRLKILKIE
ncbi:transcription elongation factor GreA [Thermanaerothrix sp.]|jgi:transcription elongation factor GreA|uniref:transcription elongation factor GreA n=1 Tax=Thermanaerothrix sp. TaxID=2972675 RepID=UPI002ADE0D67|nr:transcription elongation factor GreA [Thermanaerothrix sp.]